MRKVYGKGLNIAGNSSMKKDKLITLITTIRSLLKYNP